MSEPKSTQGELRKIEAAIQAQEALRGEDILPEEQITATLKTLQEKRQILQTRLKGTGTPTQIATGGGASVQGDVATDGGDFIGRDKIEHYHYPKSTDPKILREAYLNRLFDKTNHLSLAGIDPKAASDAEARLSLSAVYTTSFVNAFSIDVLEDLTPREVRVLQLRYGLLDGHIYDHKELTEKMGVSQERAIEEEVAALSKTRLSTLTALNKYNRLVLLGEPGSGKSSFINFVALCLAGEALGRQDANLARLTEDQPLEEEPLLEKEKLNPQSWDHSALLPVRVILRDFAAEGLPASGQPATAQHLWDFIIHELDKAALGEYASHLRQEFLERGGLLMLDGLDEVPEANLCREQIRRVVEDFATTFQHCRILVTSRTYAYQRQDWRLTGFEETVLAPFSSNQIRIFVERWYAHITALRSLDPEDAQGRAELLKHAIFSSDRLRALAGRPLILTLMASLHAWRGGSLPEKREQLYADTVDLLLDWWESQRVVRDTLGSAVMIQPSLAEWLKIDRDKMRELLNRLAYQAHTSQPELNGTANIPEGTLVSDLMRISQNPDVNPVRLVEYLSQRAGLLVPHGIGYYTFPHRTFQEYLAACYLTDHDYPDQVAELTREDPNRWREVALLAGAKAARGTASAIWSLVEALCFHEPINKHTEEPDLWGAHIASQALVESVVMSQISERHQEKVDRVKRWLVHILDVSNLPAVERAQAGQNLAKMGDPRFDPTAWYLPDEPLLGFVQIPAGPFTMGSDPEFDSASMKDEKPQHIVTLPDYYISRYPITVAQYCAFVENSGHHPSDSESLNGISNHPVVNVNWYDALAYCNWLTEQLRAWNETPEQLATLLTKKGWQVGLPSEAEWEKASRGVEDARIYPWGSDFDIERANTVEIGIAGTSAVGCFPLGTSPYGIHDMCGNVWEWTRSLWGKSWKETDYPYYPYHYEISKHREDLNAKANLYRVQRGGSFVDSYEFARCSVRGRDISDRLGKYFGYRIVISPPAS